MRMAEVKTVGLFYICFSLLHGFVGSLNCSSPTPESLMAALEKELFPKKLLRPVKTFSDTLNVRVVMTVVGILGVAEKSQSVTIFIWQALEWNIHGLSWDEKECGTSRVSVPREKLWVPDILITEFMDEDVSPKSEYVYLNSSGYVFDDRPIRVVGSCRLVIYTFPFDVQNCSLTFEPYLHLADDIRMIQGTTAAKTLEESRRVLQTRGEWELDDIHVAPATLDVADGSYSSIKYHVILRRRPVLYVVNLITPSCFLLTLDLFSFLLPLQTVDRSTFKMTIILGYTVFLLIMNDLLPVTGDETSLLNVFFSLSLALMVASLVETVFITKILFSSSQWSVAPQWLSILVLKYLAAIVCLPPTEKKKRVTVSFPSATAKNIDLISKDLIVSHGPPPEKVQTELTLDELKKLSRDLSAIRLQMENHFQGSKASQEWQMIGLVMDRLLFGLYILFLTVSVITMITIWVSY